jgi:hypothetical protein
MGSSPQRISPLLARCRMLPSPLDHSPTSARSSSARLRPPALRVAVARFRPLARQQHDCALHSKPAGHHRVGDVSMALGGQR